MNGVDAASVKYHQCAHHMASHRLTGPQHTQKGCKLGKQTPSRRVAQDPAPLTAEQNPGTGAGWFDEMAGQTVVRDGVWVVWMVAYCGFPNPVV